MVSLKRGTGDSHDVYNSIIQLFVCAFYIYILTGLMTAGSVILGTPFTWPELGVSFNVIGAPDILLTLKR